jgi:hypothetical protein
MRGYTVSEWCREGVILVRSSWIREKSGSEVHRRKEKEKEEAKKELLAADVLQKAGWVVQKLFALSTKRATRPGQVS